MEKLYKIKSEQSEVTDCFYVAPKKQNIENGPLAQPTVPPFFVPDRRQNIGLDDRPDGYSTFREGVKRE